MDDITTMTSSLNDSDYTNHSDILLAVDKGIDPACNFSTCNGPHRFEGGTLALMVYGYLSPLLIVITLVTNCLVCAVLCKKAFRSPTNILLVAMAVSDTLTGLWPAPIFLGFYTTGLYKDWIPYSWCFAYFCLIEYIPTIFHTSSIWLTVCLAGQRFLYVCRPNLAKNLCTVSKTLKTIAAVYALSIFLHGFRLAEMSFHPIELQSLVKPERHVVGCYDRFSPLIKENVDAFYEAYYWTRIIVVHFLPCLLLVVLNGVLISAMKTAAKRRSQLLRQNMRMESRRLEENNSTTMMLVLVVGIFLLVEVPLAIFLVVVIVNNNNNNSSQQFMEKHSIDTVSLLINFFILVSYPLNFFIYCRMSRQFRESFKKMIACPYLQSIWPFRTSTKVQATRGCLTDTAGKTGDRLAAFSTSSCSAVKNDLYEMTKVKSDGNEVVCDKEKFTCLLTIEENTAAEC